jgi:hypothetical protein
LAPSKTLWHNSPLLRSSQLSLDLGGAHNWYDKSISADASKLSRYSSNYNKNNKLNKLTNSDVVSVNSNNILSQSLVSSSLELYDGSVARAHGLLKRDADQVLKSPVFFPKASENSKKVCDDVIPNDTTAEALPRHDSAPSASDTDVELDGLNDPPYDLMLASDPSLSQLYPIESRDKFPSSSEIEASELQEFDFLLK